MTPACAMSFDFDGELSSDGDLSRWSARRTLLFVVVSNSVLWWGIGYALHAFA